MLRALARSAQTLAARGFASAAAGEHTGLVEIRQYVMKPEGIKVRGTPRLWLLPLLPPPTCTWRLALHVAADASQSLPETPALQDFMRLTGEKKELRTSLLPFLG